MNYSYKYLFISLLCLLLFATCKKVELPSDMFGDPVFTMDGVVNNTPFSVVAGDDNFYLYTSFQRDNLGVHEFTGSFAKDEDCPSSCSEKLSITIRDFQAVESGRVIIDEALSFTEYKYVAPRTVTDSLVNTYDVAFNNLSTSSSFDATNYEWDFGNGLNSTARIPPVQTYADTTFFNPVTLKTSLQNGSCENQITKSISIDDLTCAALFNFIGDTLTVLPNNSNPPYDYAWSTGDNSQTIFFPDSLFSVAVTVTDASNCVEVLNFEASSNTDFCSAAFDFEVTEQIDTVQISINDSINLSKVKIAYTTPDGVEYFSERAEQGAESSFVISEVINFEDNENGEPTKKFSVSFTCLLRSEDGDQIEIQNMSGVIAVAHPQ